MFCFIKINLTIFAFATWNLLRLRKTQNALQLPVLFLFFFQPYPEYRENSEQKIISQTIE